MELVGVILEVIALLTEGKPANYGVVRFLIEEAEEDCATAPPFYPLDKQRRAIAARRNVTDCDSRRHVR
jgi:hypothetical protein